MESLMMLFINRMINVAEYTQFACIDVYTGMLLLVNFHSHKLMYCFLERSALPVFANLFCNHYTRTMAFSAPIPRP